MLPEEEKAGAQAGAGFFLCTFVQEFVLCLVKSEVAALSRQQFPVGARFYYAAALNNKNSVSIANGGKPVGYNNSHLPAQ